MTDASFLIDTDWVIDHLNGIAPVTKRLEELEPQGLALSIISVAELWEGVHFSRDAARSEQMLQEFLSGVAVIGIDEEICRRFGLLRGSLRKRGRLADLRGARSGQNFLHAACTRGTLEKNPSQPVTGAKPVTGPVALVPFSRAGRRVEGWHARRTDSDEKQVDGLMGGYSACEISVRPGIPR